MIVATFAMARVENGYFCKKKGRIFDLWLFLQRLTQSHCGTLATFEALGYFCYHFHRRPLHFGYSCKRRLSDL